MHRVFGELIGGGRPVDLDDALGSGFEVFRVADETLVDRRVGAVQNNPVVGDGGGVLGAEIPELGSVRIGAVDRPNRKLGEILGARLLDLACIEIEVVDLNATPDELDADTDSEVENRVESVEGIGNDEVAGLHRRILS